MKLVIEIDMENDAFAKGGRRREVKRILKEQVLTYISAGYAACCSGPRSLKIAELGQHSYKSDEVTCKACLTALAKARLGPNATRHPSTFKHYFRCECGAVEIGSSAPIPDSMQQYLECNVKEKATLQ